MKEIASRQDVLNIFYAKIFAADPPQPPLTQDEWTVNGGKNILTDDEIVSRARGAKRNSFLFMDLWEGRWQDYPDRYTSQSEADSALCMILAFWTQDSEQIDRLFRQSELYRPKWDEQHGEQTYGAMTIARAQEKQTTHYDPEYSQAKHLTDLGNASRFARRFQGRVLHCPQLKSWFVYSGGCWRRDESHEIMKLAAECVRSIYAEAAVATEPADRKAIALHANKSEALVRMKAMAEGASYKLSITVDAFDRSPWKLNVLNGTIDLKSGTLFPHDHTDLITKQAPVMYDPVAMCPRFTQFLAEIFPDTILGGGNLSVIRFVQKFLGYCLTSDCREQILAIAWGTGANGKSTLFNVVQSIMGDYATTTPAETLLVKRNEGINNDIAALRGSRFVLASETIEGRKMNMALVKQLTGQDVIKARFLHCEFFDFTPSFKLCLLTNHKPAASGEDGAFWRRIRLIPFTEKFEGAARDNSLKETLQQEWPGILRWMVEGCLQWQKEGLNPPEDVIQATQEYRSENDVFTDWLDECCEDAPNIKTKTVDLFQNFRDWVMKNGMRCFFSRRKFSETLKTKGAKLAMNGSGERCVVGLKLRPQSTQDFDDISGL